MCRNPLSLRRTLEAMVRSVNIPVTIKIRTGGDQSSRNALDVVKAAADAGIAWVAIHGRTRAQGYGGLAEWDLSTEVWPKARFPSLATMTSPCLSTR